MKLYARQEPTQDKVIITYQSDSKKMDTVFYKDKKALEFYALIPWHHSNRPISRKKVTLNCFNWEVEWI